MILTINDIPIHYTLAGAGEETVLLLHGWGASIDAYAPVLAPLESKYRVAAFNMPGVGESGEPSRPLTVEDYADITEKLCAELNITRCIIVCHSHGGRVAVELMTRPRCPVEVTKAVFIDAAGVPPRHGAAYKLRQSLYKGLRVLGTNKLTAPVFCEAYEYWRDRLSSADYKAASPVMRATLSNVVRADMRPKMPNITSPVLLIWGEKDTATPLSDGREMEALIPGSGLAVIPNAGHFPFVDDPGRFAAIMASFLLTEEGENE